jgi:hypothetical protein
MRLHHSSLALAASMAAFSSPVMAAERISIVVDHATVMPAPEGTATLVVGNPLIADSSIQRNNLIVLTGKSNGTTNVIAIDSSGKTIKEIIVSVASADGMIIHRGMDRVSYTCAPLCERSMRISDAKDPFNDLENNIKKHNELSQGQSTPSAAR